MSRVHNGWQRGHEYALHRPGQRKTDTATRKAIADRYADGESMAALGRAYGICVKTVRQVLIDAGVELRPARGRGRPFGGES